MNTIDLRIVTRMILNTFGEGISNTALTQKLTLIFDDTFSPDQMAAAIEQVRAEWKSCQD